MKLLKASLFLGLSFFCGCGSIKLLSFEEVPKSYYDQEYKKVSSQINDAIRISGRLDFQEIALATVYLKVIFQKDSTFAPENPKFISYQPWWDTGKGIWGFTGLAQYTYENISSRIENKYGPVLGLNQSAYKVAEKNRTKVKYPVKVPTGGIEKKENFKKYLKLARVTSYNYGAFSASQGRTVASVSTDENSAVFFPYFNIFLNKDLATIAKMDGELVINYKAFLNGYFMLCKKDSCEQASLPKGQHLTITLPLPPKEATVSTENQERINLYAQKQLGRIMSDLAFESLENLKK